MLKQVLFRQPISALIITFEQVLISNLFSTLITSLRRSNDTACVHQPDGHKRYRCLNPCNPIKGAHNAVIDAYELDPTSTSPSGSDNIDDAVLPTVKGAASKPEADNVMDILVLTEKTNMELFREA